MKAGSQLLTTIGERCRVCYTCVRECPAKAIRIAQGRATVIAERCIGCGHCVRVCGRDAKKVYRSIDEVRDLLRGEWPAAALLAPSFPAEFTDIPPPILVGRLRRMGFARVAEVAFGADLVAKEYARLLAGDSSRKYIATTCPAAVAFVEKYHPSLVPHLAPIVSPMIAMARVIRAMYGSEWRIVFIGPCLAKKIEADRDNGHGGEVDAVLTFAELREMWAENGEQAEQASPSDFDPPHPGLGALFPVSRGMLQAAGVSEDLLQGDIVAADGRHNFVQAIAEFEAGALNARLLEVLCCPGCIMGGGMSVDAPLFRRREAVSQYARTRVRNQTSLNLVTDGRLRGLDLSARFQPHPVALPTADAEIIRTILARMGKTKPDDELNCGACGYLTCRDHAVAIASGLAESEMCLPYTIERLRRSLEDLNRSNASLASAREALLNAEKLASMGQLAAGIAHEINNPLGVILLYARLLLDELPENADERDDIRLIAEQADRCKKIVSGLLNFSRRNRVNRRPTDLRALIDRCLPAVIVPESITVHIEHALRDPIAEVDEDQIIQVLTNLITNAIESMPSGGILTLRTLETEDGNAVRFEVSDTGVGIPPENRNRIFEPFFTTKQIGKGTGLGLAVAYGIVKMHAGRIEVSSNSDPAKGPTGSVFSVTLPRRGGAS